MTESKVRWDAINLTKSLIWGGNLSTNLMKAIKNHNLSILKILLLNEEDCIDTFSKSLRETIKYDFYKGFDLLLKHDMDCFEHPKAALCHVIENPPGNKISRITKYMHRFLHHYKDAMNKAPQSKRKVCLRMQIERYDELLTVIDNQNLDQLRKLLKRSAYRKFSNFSDSLTPGVIAVRLRKLRVIQVYLEMKVNVKWIMYFSFEFETRCFDILEMCLDYGANPQEIMYLNTCCLTKALHISNPIPMHIILNRAISQDPPGRVRGHLCFTHHCGLDSFFRKLELIAPELANLVRKEIVRFPLHKGIDETASYKEEIVKLQSTTISCGTMHSRSQTLYDYLFFDPHRAAAYSNNINLKQLSRKGFWECYPHYGFALEYQWQRGACRRELMDTAQDFMMEAVGSGMPKLILDEIFKNFNEEQLRRFEKVNCEEETT